MPRRGLVLPEPFRVFPRGLVGQENDVRGDRDRGGGASVVRRVVVDGRRGRRRRLLLLPLHVRRHRHGDDGLRCDGNEPGIVVSRERRVDLPSVGGSGGGDDRRGRRQCQAGRIIKPTSSRGPVVVVATRDCTAGASSSSCCCATVPSSFGATICRLVVCFLAAADERLFRIKFESLNELLTNKKVAYYRLSEGRRPSDYFSARVGIGLIYITDP